MILNKPSSVLSTKKLTLAQQELLLNAGVGVVHFDILNTEWVQTPLNLHGDAVIITSKNALKALEQVPFSTPVYCVGSVTASMVNTHQVAFVAQNGLELAQHISQHHNNQQFDYLCSEQRRDELPDFLKAQNIALNAHIVYRSHEVLRRFDRIFAAVLFFSPRGVIAFAKANPNKTPHTICIGTTTATEAAKWYDKVSIAAQPTVENTIVTAIKLLKND
jgi:uroporphyrinogen-III synthase